MESENKTLGVSEDEAHDSFCLCEDCTEARLANYERILPRIEV